MKQKLTIEDKIVVALILEVDRSDTIGFTPDGKPIHTPHFNARVDAQIEYFKSLVMDKIDETIGFNWTIHFREFIAPKIYEAYIICNDKTDFLKISAILKNEIKDIKFDSINHSGHLPDNIEIQ
jgi:hypothetical protein